MPQSRVALKKVVDTVARFYSIKAEDIYGVKRKQRIVQARHIVCYLAHEKFKKSSPSIGKRLGGRDHSSILHASLKIKKSLLHNKELREDIDKLFLLLEHDSYSVKVKTQVSNKPKRKRESDAMYRKKVEFSPEQLERQTDILEKYREGWTLGEIAQKYQLTRERIRQLVEQGLFYEYDKSDFKDAMDLKKFTTQQKSKHLVIMRKEHGIGKKQRIVKEKTTKWSKEFNHCRKCASTEIKHVSYGYCRRCYPKTEVFKEIQRISRLRNIRKRRIYVSKYAKEYSKRAEVIAKRKRQEDLKHFGGNRARAMLRDRQQCKRCGLSRVETKTKYGRDLHVLHVGDKSDNRLENLITLCPKCFRIVLTERKKTTS
jgi:hypothetical protein